MPDSRAQTHLAERFERAVASPPLMMLYPPVATGRAFEHDLDAAALWEGSPSSGTLYLHIPFCRSRCPFCPFYAVVGSSADHARYVDDLLAEAALYAPAVGHVAFSSVYLGGGTPSILSPALVDRLLRGLGATLRIEGADVTLEAHPATVDRARLQALAAAGVTRLSLGVQSFDREVLAACGRADTADRVLSTLAAALDTPFREVNIDLMYGLPRQTRQSWIGDLDLATRFEVPGLTLYATVYLPAFASLCETRGHAIPDLGERHAMYDLAYEYLTAAGYSQPRFGAGAFQRHGLNPHRRNVSLGLPTLGLGTWAFSSNERFAYHNRTPAADWAEDIARRRLPIRQLVRISERERARKYTIEALLLAYVDLAHFRTAFGTRWTEAFPDELAVLETRGLARIEDGELRLTREGGRHLREIRYLFASDEVVGALENGARGL